MRREIQALAQDQAGRRGAIERDDQASGNQRVIEAAAAGCEHCQAGTCDQKVRNPEKQGDMGDCGDAPFGE